MRILLDQAVYGQRNKGNDALLQAAVARMRRLWPHATIDALTEAPHILKFYCPDVHPVSIFPWKDWSDKRREFDILHRFVPTGIWRISLELRDELENRRARKQTAGAPSPANLELDFGSDTDLTIHDKLEKGPDLLQAIKSADLVVATGGGYLVDSDKFALLQVYDTLEMAIRLGKPTVMVGQGVGYIENTDLREKLSRLLPLVDLILIREEKVAQPVLSSLGVCPERVCMTGDDAVEMAFAARTHRWGTAIGINLRVANYTGVGRGYIEKIRPILHQAAFKYKAKLIALPVSSGIQVPDQAVIQQLLSGYGDIMPERRRFVTPLEVIKKIGLCRVVVTGAFHPAVFALAQGIPVVGLVKSVEYYNKFSGLRDQFGPACQILHLNDEHLGEKLPASIDAAWESAPEARSPLLEAAEHQIQLNQAGYQRLYEVVTARMAAFRRNNMNES